MSNPNPPKMNLHWLMTSQLNWMRKWTDHIVYDYRQAPFSTRMLLLSLTMVRETWWVVKTAFILFAHRFWFLISGKPPGESDGYYSRIGIPAGMGMPDLDAIRGVREQFAAGARVSTGSTTDADFDRIANGPLEGTGLPPPEPMGIPKMLELLNNPDAIGQVSISLSELRELIAAAHERS